MPQLPQAHPFPGFLLSLTLVPRRSAIAPSTIYAQVRREVRDNPENLHPRRSETGNQGAQFLLRPPQGNQRARGPPHATRTGGWQREPGEVCPTPLPPLFSHHVSEPRREQNEGAGSEFIVLTHVRAPSLEPPIFLLSTLTISPGFSSEIKGRVSHARRSNLETRLSCARVSTCVLESVFAFNTFVPAGAISAQEMLPLSSFSVPP